MSTKASLAYFVDEGSGTSAHLYEERLASIDFPVFLAPSRFSEGSIDVTPQGTDATVVSRRALAAKLGARYTSQEPRMNGAVFMQPTLPDRLMQFVQSDPERTETIIIGLVATLPRRVSTLFRAVSSMALQTRSLDALVIVSDGALISDAVEDALRRLLPSCTITFLANHGMRGAAETWNKGIRFIKSQWSNAYVAILDDDDIWDPVHIEACEAKARLESWPDAVVSGLRMSIDEEEVLRDPLLSVSVEDFLVGNPGWQGSNTFVRLDALVDAGCFTDGLRSCNDRDLAIRLLTRKGSRVVFTGRHTATWFLDATRQSLSSRRGEAKRAGLARFYELHGHRMDDEIRQRFFDRARTLFGWSESEILGTSQLVADA